MYPVVETIEKRREPMPAMEAIYLIGSSEASVKCLLQDFSSQNRTTYKFAHVYFTEGEWMILGKQSTNCPLHCSLS